MATDTYFPHERLKVFHKAVEFAGWAHSVRNKLPTAELRKQLSKAAESVVLNICEGAGSAGGNKRKHFQIAYGSAAECHGAATLCKAYGVPRSNEAIELLGHLRRMLAGVLRACC